MKFNLYPLDRWGNNRIKKICAIEEDYFGNGILNVTAVTTGIVVVILDTVKKDLSSNWLNFLTLN